MTEGVSPRRSDRLLIVLFAVIGAAISLWWLLVFGSPVNDPVGITISEFHQPGPHHDATLTVMFFGRFGYTRTAPDAAAFHTEVVFWQLAPFLVPLLGGTLGGGLAGYLVGRWTPRARY